MDQRISLITLGVRDIIRSAGFYESLGWCRVDSPDGVVVFDLLGQTLGLYPRENLANDLGLDPAQIGGFLGITLGYNVREKPEVAAILAKFGQGRTSGRARVETCIGCVLGRASWLFHRPGCPCLGGGLQPVFAFGGQWCVPMERCGIWRNPAVIDRPQVEAERRQF